MNSILVWYNCIWLPGSKFFVDYWLGVCICWICSEQDSANETNRLNVGIILKICLIYLHMIMWQWQFCRLLTWCLCMLDLYWIRFWQWQFCRLLTWCFCMLVMYWIRFCKWNKQVKCWHYTQNLFCIPAHDYVAVTILSITDLVFVCWLCTE